jgi:bifunctional non-homologous end joining protein LigD
VALRFPVSPMKAVLGKLPDAADDHLWAYEIKFDGYRTIVHVNGGSVTLQSSNNLDVTARYPELTPIAAAVNADRAILDGEAVVLDDAGRPRFDLIQRHERQAAFYAFDVLSVNGHDTIGLPYEQRRALLEDVVDPGPNWMVPAHRIGDGAALLDATREQGLEGVMAKRLGSTYLPGRRTPHWRKVKNRVREVLVIGGWMPGSGNRAGTFGSLLVGTWDADGRLRFGGGVGTGFSQALLEDLRARLAALRTSECPFDPPPPREYVRFAKWVRPELSAEVEFTEWTNDGLVRQSSFVKLVS